MAGDDYRQVSYDVWQRMAAGWDRQRRWMWEVSHVVGEWMVEALAPQPGETILELASGTGETGFAAAAALGGEGRLISTDFAPKMVDVARGESQRLGLANVEHRVLDAEGMDLEDASVDGVLCRWGYMLMADPQAALRETRRVLREGGRLVLSVWPLPGTTPGLRSRAASSWSRRVRRHRIRPTPESSRWPMPSGPAPCSAPLGSRSGRWRGYR